MIHEVIRQDLEEIFARDIPWEDLRGKTVLITGAYGMLASYVTNMLIYLNEVHGFGITVKAFVRSAEKCRKRFGSFADRPYFEICTASLTEEIRVAEDVDYIIHAASLASPQYYDVCPVEVLEPNAIGTYRLLKLAAEKKVKGFLLFSTGDVYGSVKNADAIREDTLGTLDPLDIHSCYGESKRMAETMGRAFCHQYGVPFRSVRIWHTYGPTMDIDRDPRVFASFVSDIVHKRDIVMKSDGLAKRSFCYIADAVAGYFTVLLKGLDGEAYNVCNSEAFLSIRELAEIMTSLRPELGLKVIRRERPQGEHYLENTAANFIPPSGEKLEALGWKCAYDVRSGFDQVLKAFL